MLPRSSKRCPPPEDLLPPLPFCVEGLPVGICAAFCRFAAILSRRTGAPGVRGRPVCAPPCWGRGDLPPVYPPSKTRVLIVLLLGAGVGGTYILLTSPLGRISSRTAGFEVGSIFLSCLGSGFAAAFSSFGCSFAGSAATGADCSSFSAGAETGVSSFSSFSAGSCAGRLSSFSFAAGSSVTASGSETVISGAVTSSSAGCCGADGISSSAFGASASAFSFSAASALNSSARRASSSAASRASRRERIAVIRATALAFSEAMAVFNAANLPVLYAPSCFTASCVVSFFVSLIATS